MARDESTAGPAEPTDPRTTEEAEKRLEQELLIQEQLESLAWPIWNDIETRIAYAVQAYNADSGAQTKLHLSRRQESYQMSVHRHDSEQALIIKLETQTGLITFGSPTAAGEGRLVVRIEGESSYRIERYPSAEVVNPSELAGVILSKLL